LHYEKRLLFLPFCLLLTLGVQAKFQGVEKLDNYPELSLKFQQEKDMKALHQDLVAWCDGHLKDYVTQEEKKEAITTYFEERMKEKLADAVEELKKDFLISNRIVRFIFDYKLSLLLALLAAIVVVVRYYNITMNSLNTFIAAHELDFLIALMAASCFGMPMLLWLYLVKIYPIQLRSKKYHKYAALSYNIDEIDHELLRFHCEVFAPKCYRMTPKNREKFMHIIKMCYLLVGTSGAWKELIQGTDDMLKGVMPEKRISFDDLAISKANEKAKNLSAKYVEGEEILRKLQQLLIFLETAVKIAKKRNLHPADFALGQRLSVLVQGKWGTGKTHLIQQFLQELGINVVSGDLSEGNIIQQLSNMNKEGTPSAMIWDDGDRYWNNKDGGILSSDLAILDPKALHITDSDSGLEYHLPLVNVIIANYEVNDPAMRDRFSIVISTEKGFTDKGAGEICIDYMYALIKEQQEIGHNISLEDFSQEEQMRVCGLYQQDPEEKSLRPSFKLINQLVYERVAEKKKM
jgi:hypothetical protein